LCGTSRVIDHHHTTGRFVPISHPVVTSCHYGVWFPTKKQIPSIREGRGGSLPLIDQGGQLLSSVPQDASPVPPHLSLQLEHAVEKSLGGGWASGNVNVDGHDSVTTSDDRVRVAESRDGRKYE